MADQLPLPLAEKLRGAYSEEIARQIRELRFFRNQGPQVERLMGEREKLLGMISILAKIPNVDAGVDACRNYFYQAEALVNQRLRPHLEEVARLITSTSGQSGANRAVWENVRQAVLAIVQLADQYLTALGDLYKTLLPELQESLRSVPSLPSTQVAAKKTGANLFTFAELLSQEGASLEVARPYELALQDLEKAYQEKRSQVPSPRFSSGLLSLIVPADRSAYRSVHDPSYINVESFQETGGLFSQLLERFPEVWDKFPGVLKPLTIQVIDDGGNMNTRPIHLNKLFRNTRMHTSLLLSVDQDVRVDLAMRLYFRPSWNHFREFQILLDQGLLTRLSMRERSLNEVRTLIGYCNALQANLKEFELKIKERL